jgi:hypothetical protein
MLDAQAGARRHDRPAPSSTTGNGRLLNGKEIPNETIKKLFAKRF